MFNQYWLPLPRSLKHSGALLGSNSMRNRAVMRIAYSIEWGLSVTGSPHPVADNMLIVIPCQEKPIKESYNAQLLKCPIFPIGYLEFSTESIQTVNIKSFFPVPRPLFGDKWHLSLR